MKRIALSIALLALVSQAVPPLRAAPESAPGAVELAQAACPAPYHVQTSDGRCVWSCAAGTRPDAASGTCVCQAGHIPAGTQSRGRLVCVRGDQAAPAAPPAPSGGPIMVPKPAIPELVLKLGTSIAMPAKWTRLQGMKMNLFAMLLDQRGAPAGNEVLLFRVFVHNAGRPMHSCRARTDEHGRAVCLVPIPVALDDYDVKVAFEGSPGLAASTAASRILGESAGGFEAELAGGDGVRVEAHGIMGGFGIRVPLRAVLTRQGRPLANERVEIAANGVHLARIHTNEAGIAKLHWTPDAQLLRNFFLAENVQTRRKVGYIGTLEFWHLPAVGSRAAPAVRTVKGDFRLTDPSPLCGLVSHGHERDGYPHKCSASTTAQRSLAILRGAAVTVHQNRFGHADGVADGHFRMEMPQPPDPPANRDCDAGVVNVPNACRTSCSRLEYLTFHPLGDLNSLQGPPGGGDARCGWALTDSVAPSQIAINEAHDACAIIAQRQGLARWNHSVATVMPVRVAAAFGFRDPHTRGERGNWEYKLFLQHKLLSTTFDLPVNVSCR